MLKRNDLIANNKYYFINKYFEFDKNLNICLLTYYIYLKQKA